MDRLISCEFNMDTACVELKFADGSMIAIDTIAVENEVTDNMYQRSELDYLIYKDPIGYADLILDSDPESISDTWKSDNGETNDNVRFCLLLWIFSGHGKLEAMSSVL